MDRKVSVTSKPNSRSGRYHIVDPYLRFYYRFLEKRQDQIALGIQEPALAEITRHMIDFIGQHTWEELCREWVLRSITRKVLPFMPDQVGRAWNKNAEIDVAGINSMEKTMILGECKWGQSASDRPILKTLVGKTDQVIPTQGKWRVYFLGFSRSGWTSGAKSFEDEVNSAPLTGSNWQSAGMSLVDLNQVSRDLAEWL